MHDVNWMSGVAARGAVVESVTASALTGGGDLVVLAVISRWERLRWRLPVVEHRLVQEPEDRSVASRLGERFASRTILEGLTRIRRSGADVILTYWAAEVAAQVDSGGSVGGERHPTIVVPVHTAEGPGDAAAHDRDQSGDGDGEFTGGGESAGPGPQYGQYQQPGYGQQPQYRYGQAHYGQGSPGSSYDHLMPADPAASLIPRPTEVRTTFWLWVGSIVLGVLGLVLNYVDGSDQLESFVDDADGELSVTTARSVVNVVIVFYAAFYAVWYGLTLFFAFMMRSGTNWARITLTVFAGLILLQSFTELAAQNAASATLTVLRDAVVIAAVVFMYSGRAREYFAKRPGR